MTLTPLPKSRFDPPTRSLSVSIIAWLGIIAGALGCINVAIQFLSPQPAPLRLAVSAPIALAVAIGLRMRLEWARRGYIAALAFGFFAIAIQLLRQDTGPSIVAAVIVASIFYGLIIAKLCSRSVREEFDASSHPSA